MALFNSFNWPAHSLRYLFNIGCGEYLLVYIPNMTKRWFGETEQPG
jgi:hypothetical protein